MMTYAECYMAKYAKSEPSQYEIIDRKMKAGDEYTLKAMDTPSGQEIFWNVAGAGLGGLGAYLLSSRFRRNASKRQRAVDVLLGALLGFGGTQVALNMTGDEKSGLSLKETMRADKIIGDKAKDNSQGEDSPNWISPNTWNVGAAGAATVPYIGYRIYGKTPAGVEKAVAEATEAAKAKGLMGAGVEKGSQADLQAKAMIANARRPEEIKAAFKGAVAPATASYLIASIIKGVADKASGSSDGR